MILNCESLKDKLFVDKVGEKIIQGARLKFAWSSSPNELASDPAEIVFLDEVDRMKILKEEGDPVEIAVGRTASFPDGKLVITSTPTVQGKSRVEELYLDGTRFEWHIPCLRCEEYFAPRLSLFKWKYNKEKRVVKDAWLQCPL